MARKANIGIQFSFETTAGNEITLDVEANLTPYVPARIHPVDKSHDAEGGELEDITLKLNGVEVDLDDMVEMGLSMKKLEEALYEAGNDQEDDYDEDCDERDYWDDAP